MELPSHGRRHPDMQDPHLLCALAAELENVCWHQGQGDKMDCCVAVWETLDNMVVMDKPEILKLDFTGKKR